MTDKITELLAESRRIEEAATAGPWVWRGDSFDDEEHSCPHGTEWTDHGPDLETVAQEPPYSDGSQSAVASVITSFGYDASGLTVKQADAEFIAYARTSEPRMRRALEAVLAVTPHRYPDSDDPERNLGDPVLWQAEVFRAIESALTEEEP